MSKKNAVLERLADKWEKWNPSETFLPWHGDYVFTRDEVNEETIYELERRSGSIKLSMTEDIPEDDPVWEMAAKVLEIQ